jgi:Glycosyltransferase
MKTRILVVCDYYLPGIKGGGGMWAVKNIVERFSDIYDFFVITRNHDGRDDLTPYETVKTGQWNDIAKTKVFYLEPGNVTARKIASLVEEVRPKAVFLNSVFSTPVVKFLVARRRKLFKCEVAVILASCGELSDATLKMKRAKKTAYLTAAKAFGLYNSLIWRASFPEESAEIRKVFGQSCEIHLAPDLTPDTILPRYDQLSKPAKRAGHAKLIFLSRIARKKNLLFLLTLLSKFTSGDIELEIAGSFEDAGYWAECEDALKDLGDNISVSVSGALSNEEALGRLVDSHFFVLPTLNENFGYVCIEALAAGCPLILSDQTIWSNLEDKGIGWNTPLNDESSWLNAITAAVAMDSDNFESASRGSRQFALDWLADPSVERATANLLGLAVSRAK